MVRLYEQATGTLIGEISDEEFQFMVEELEEEGLEDRDYSLTRLTLDYFDGRGDQPHLVELLRGALGSRDEVTVRWTRG